METTVTMDLRRYKELESYEKLIREKIADKSLIWHSGYNGDYIVEISDGPNAGLLDELKTAVEFRDKTIEKVRAYEKKTGKKVFE
jgi:hypothetical protein